MLEGDYSTQLKQLIAKLPNRVKVPENLLEILSQRGPVAQHWKDRRQCARFHFYDEAILEIEGSLQAIHREKAFHRVFTKDISRSGISFLHHEQLFPGEKVTIWAPIRKLQCVVMHCTRQGPDCYIVGAALGDDVPEQRFERLKDDDSLIPELSEEETTETAS